MKCSACGTDLANQSDYFECSNYLTFQDTWSFCWTCFPKKRYRYLFSRQIRIFDAGKEKTEKFCIDVPPPYCSRCKIPVIDKEHYEFSMDRINWHPYCLYCSNLCGSAWKYRRKLTPAEEYKPVDSAPVLEQAAPVPVMDAEYAMPFQHGHRGYENNKESLHEELNKTGYIYDVYTNINWEGQVGEGWWAQCIAYGSRENVRQFLNSLEN